MYLYVIGAESGPYKIGIANDPYHRLRNLQTGNPNVLSCLILAKDDCAPRYERVAHQSLREFLVSGEWFDTSLENIKSVLAAIPLDFETLKARSKPPEPLIENEINDLLDGKCDASMFARWRKSLGLNRTEAADELGMGRNQPQRYEDGQPIPKYVAMAMATYFLRKSGLTT
jgi:hypothetical protein